MQQVKWTLYLVNFYIIWIWIRKSKELCEFNNKYSKNNPDAFLEDYLRVVQEWRDFLEYFHVLKFEFGFIKF